MKKIIALLLTLLLAVGLIACGSSSQDDSNDAAFTLDSNDTVGATKHIVVGNDREPSGTYKVVCVGGHGAITVNDTDLTVLANDDYIGKEYSGLTYTESITLTLNGNDTIVARAFNSSDFKLEFYLDDSTK